MGDDREDPFGKNSSASRAPDPERVKSRAEGRPPEEQWSEDPEAQAEAVLEDSEERVAERSAESENQGSA